MRPLSLSISLSLSIAGCASLHGDGYYACAQSTQCPSTAPICAGDHRCHTSAVDAGDHDAGSAADAGALADTNLPPLAYPACNGDTPATCGADVCYSDATLDATNDGYCTRRCASDAECPAFDGASSACIRGQCMRGCTSPSDCVDALACTSGRWVDGAALRLCATLPDAEVNWYMACEIDGDCERPLSCVHGYCLRACATTLDCVEGLELCISDSVGTRACLYNCSSAADCSTLDATCAGGGCHPSTTW